MNIEKKFTRDATNETPNFIEIFKSERYFNKLINLKNGFSS